MQPLRNLLVVILLLGVVSFDVRAAEPIISDSRIKTFVYNENDVYTLTTHYGYQSNIEFAKNERIETVSLGDRIAWQIVPAGRRLFVRPQEEGVTTNMTVITNKRSYQFDLRAEAGKLKPNAQLAYVVRFYYPADGVAQPMVSPAPAAPVRALAPAPLVSAQPQQAFSPVPTAPITSAPLAPAGFVPPAPPQVTTQNSSLVNSSSVNLNYTYTGSDAIAPLKVFDNGKATFFRFQPYKGQQVPAISVPSSSGTALPIQVRPVKEGYWAVPMVSKQFQLRYDGAGEIVTVYNEGS